jgi:chemotaxis signal transduction protein
MSTAGAWLLDVGGRRAAVGVREQVHLMHEPQVAELAATPAHCRHVLFWNGRCVPVMDLDVWLTARGTLRMPMAKRHVGIYAYQPDASGAIDFGAFWLARPPQRIDVDDADAAPLPADGAGWSRIATACFADGVGPVPILDLARIFSAAVGA